MSRGLNLTLKEKILVCLIYPLAVAAMPMVIVFGAPVTVFILLHIIINEENNG
jgi:hypothetical protein